MDDRAEPTEIERRALARIQDDITHKRYRAVALAKRTGRVPSTISNILAGKRALNFETIEAAAALKGVDPGEYLADPRSEVRVLEPVEAEVLRYIRSWPKHVQSILADFLRYFGTAAEAEQQARDLVAYFRKLGHKEKQSALASMLLRSEGRLPKDVAAPPPAPTPLAPAVDVAGLPSRDVKLVRELAQTLRLAQKKKGLSTASRG